jgi:predicted AAA+ superfamily ATPase
MGRTTAVRVHPVQALLSFIINILTILILNIKMVIMYWPRLLEHTLTKTLKTFPAVVITGPRQSGKSTLVDHFFPKNASFINLDNINFRRLLEEDPYTYLKKLRKPVVIDEIQYMPEIIPYIKILIDEHRIPGQWIITGSQQFSVMKGVSESLAGRAAILSLPTFQISERRDIDGLGEYLLAGSYPEPVVNKKIDPLIWYSGYIQTYLERDLRSIINIPNLRDFESFLRLTAAHVSQEFNASKMSTKIGVSVPTIKRWISVLESSYILFFVPPFYENYGKRIIKSPKLYFYDSGLVNFLIGIKDSGFLLSGPMAGALFENAVVSELYKLKYARGVKPEMYFWRSQSGIEIDIIIPENGRYIPYEIKLSSSIKPLFYKNLLYWFELTGSKDIDGFLITNCTQDQLPLPGNIKNLYWKDLAP